MPPNMTTHTFHRYFVLAYQISAYRHRRSQKKNLRSVFIFFRLDSLIWIPHIISLTMLNTLFHLIDRGCLWCLWAKTRTLFFFVPGTRTNIMSPKQSRTIYKNTFWNKNWHHLFSRNQQNKDGEKRMERYIVIFEFRIFSASLIAKNLYCSCEV